MEIAGQGAELPEIKRRARLFAVLVLLVFGGLATRLFFLQVLEGETFYRVTSDSIVRTSVLPAVRGEIRDRKGRTLATTRPAYDVVVIPNRIDQATYETVLGLLSEANEELPDWQGFIARVADRRDRPYALAEDVPHEVMAAIETGLESRGVQIQAHARRHYPHGTLAAHTLGFLNEVGGEELRTLKEEGYHAGDLVGRTGVEKQWEPYLRGRKGMRKTLAQRKGLRPGDINIEDLVDGPVKVDPVPGENLVLTLDLDVQKIAERALGPHRAGGVVVLDIDTGRILAVASKPGFDSNQMSGRLKPDLAAQLFSDPFRPFRDRTLNETYNPGSTFKVLTVLAALEDGLVDPEERTPCNRFIDVGGRRFKCKKAHGPMNLHQALVQSCNVYFYELAMRPGMMDRLARYASQLGLGSPSGLGLNGEQPGLVPTEAWHQARGPRGFMIGHAINTAIGEGATRVTAMQMALVYAAIAKDGVLWLPQIIERIESGDGEILEQFPPRVRRQVTLSPETLGALRRALVGVVQNPKGTAWKARSERVVVAGKTGTAQVRAARTPRPGDPPLPYAGMDHAWFAGFAPADPRSPPRIAFAVVIEHGGGGGEVAAPVAIQIAERYMDLVGGETAQAPSSVAPQHAQLER
jgi:penicillin-binding protein 2